MIEKKLLEIIDEYEWLPNSLRDVFDDLIFPQSMPLKDCWEELVKRFAGDGLNSFWRVLGFSDKSDVSLLFCQLRTTIITATIYFGLDYLFDKQYPETYEIYNQDVLKLLCPDINSESEEYFGNGVRKIEEVYDRFSKEAPRVKKNTESIFDPYGINPYVLIKQKNEYSENRYHDREHEMVSFFPEVSFYLQRTIRISEPLLGISRGSINRAKVQVHSLLKSLPLLLLQAGPYLPGHKNTMSGTWTMQALHELDEIARKYYDPDCAVISNELANRRSSEVLMRWGIEDLLHLNRISNAVAKFYDFIDGKDISKRQCESVALFFSILVHSPSVDIQNFFWNDVNKCAWAYLNGESSTEEDKWALRRLLSINSIVCPAVLCIFARALFFQRGEVDSQMILQRISEFESDDITDEENSIAFLDDNKVWDDSAYYDQKIEYKRKGKKGKTTKYVPKKSRVLKSKELLIRFTIQEKYKFKNDTIILSNKIRMGHWKKMGRLDIAERCRCDASAYLESLIAEIDKDCNEIPKEKT